MGSIAICLIETSTYIITCRNLVDKTIYCFKDIV